MTKSRVLHFINIKEYNAMVLSISMLIILYIEINDLSYRFISSEHVAIDYELRTTL